MTSKSRLLRLVLAWAPSVSLAAFAAYEAVRFVSGGMGAVYGWFALQLFVPPLAILLFLGALVALGRTRRFRAPIAAALAVSLLTVWPCAWLFGKLAFPFPWPRAEAHPSIVVRSPLDATTRVFWGGDSLAKNHHASFPDQRWAYDLTVEPSAVGSERLEDYGCWGVPVVAPASGVVHLAHDGEADGKPGEVKFDPKNVFGNHVVIRLPEGTYLILAHLQKGSVVAKEGAAVHPGDALARCGNSGHTSEPHLHIHHQRQDPKVARVNMAEGLPLFFEGAKGPWMPEGGFRIEGDVVVLTGDVVPSQTADLR